MGEMYQELVACLKQNKLKEQIEIRFIDIFKDNLDGYDSVEEALEKGLVLPITAIQGRIIDDGDLSKERIYAEIKRLL